MIDKEAAELRRRFRPDRSSITKVHGCYVNQFGEIVTTFDESLTLLPAEVQEKYLELLKKSLSGRLGGTLSDISFTTAQVKDSEEHRLLSRLRDTKLEDEEGRMALYQKIAGSVHIAEVSLLILLAWDCYDVPFRGKDGSLQEGDTQFSFVVCTVCPVKETKPSLRYDAKEKAFRNQGADWVVGNPELGFLFPAFDDRATNLYGALMYNRSKKDGYDDFVEAVFRTKPVMALEVQHESFREVMADALEDECSAKVVQTVHTQLRDLVQTHKEARDPEPLRVGCEELSDILESTGVTEQKLASFRVRYEQTFGLDSELPPQNLIGASKLEYKTPSVTVKVDPDRSDLIELREMGDTKYLLVRADEGLEINGIPVQ